MTAPDATRRGTLNFMHYKNGRPAQKGDWVVGETHNSNGQLRIGYVKELNPDGGTCNAVLHIWLTNYDYAGSVPTLQQPHQYMGETDYAYTAKLLHVVDGYRLASICAEAWKWDSEINPMIWGPQ